MHCMSFLPLGISWRGIMGVIYNSIDGQTLFYLQQDYSPFRSSLPEYEPEVTATGDQLKRIVTLYKILDFQGVWTLVGKFENTFIDINSMTLKGYEMLRQPMQWMTFKQHTETTPTSSNTDHKVKNQTHFLC